MFRPFPAFRLSVFANVVLLAAVLVFSLPCAAQKPDTTRVPSRFAASATITNNGISLIPSFSLGKPAGIADLSIGRRFSFEPQFRFALDGKPWSYIFWLRYKVVRSNRFTLNVGAHPAVIFRTITTNVGGVNTNVLSGQRYLAAEVVPNYYIRKNFSVGLYYLVSAGASESATRATNFLTVNANISNIAIQEGWYLRFNPQLFYLRMDDREGTYYSSSVTLSTKKLPVSLQSMFTGPFESNLIGGQNFLWNVSLIYAVSQNFVPVK